MITPQPAPAKSTWRFKLISLIFVSVILLALYALTSGPSDSDSSTYGPTLSQP